MDFLQDTHPHPRLFGERLLIPVELQRFLLAQVRGHLTIQFRAGCQREWGAHVGAQGADNVLRLTVAGALRHGDVSQPLVGQPHQLTHSAQARLNAQAALIAQLTNRRREPGVTAGEGNIR